MKRLTVGLAAGILLLLGVAGVAGVGTARAAESTPLKTYCLDNQTFTTSDAFEQSVFAIAIGSYGGTATSAEIVRGEGPDPDAAEEGGSLFDFIYNDATTGDDFGDYGTWSQAQIEERIHATVTDVRVYHMADGACASSAAPTSVWTPPPPREAYCSVAGNTWQDGTPIVPGTFLNLAAGQPATDKHYTGAVPAFWVEGVGLTCSLTPAQAALAAASTLRAGGAGDIETPIPGVPDYAIYPYVPAK
jgi:hypothetical protein